MANTLLLNKGIKYLAWSLPLFFIGPTLIYNAFQNQHTNWHYVMLGVGIIACYYAVYCMFKGIMALVNSLFKK